MGEFPGGPGVRTQCSHCYGPGSIPGCGTKILQAVQHSEMKERNPDSKPSSSLTNQMSLAKWVSPLGCSSTQEMELWRTDPSLYPTILGKNWSLGVITHDSTLVEWKGTQAQTLHKGSRSLPMLLHHQSDLHPKGTCWISSSPLACQCCISSLLLKSFSLKIPLNPTWQFSICCLSIPPWSTSQ